METRTLCNGVKMPLIGMGTYPLKGKNLLHIVSDAVTCGYRLFDTSDNYYNETDLGEAIKKIRKKGKYDRNDFSLVTKLSDDLHPQGYQMGRYFWKTSSVMQSTGVKRVVQKKVDNSLLSLQTEFIDLLLIHWPYPDYYLEIWECMEEIYRQGKVRAIGVCNCRERHLNQIIKSGTVPPMVNQIEVSPLNTKQSLISFCKKHDIQLIVYSPLMSIRLPQVNKSVLINAMMTKYEKTLAQIILRWNIQKGFIPIPKSSSIKRLSENIKIFDFLLTQEEIEHIDRMNIDYQYLPESVACPGI